VSFSFDTFDGIGRVFPLRGDVEPIVLDDAGIRHPRSQRGRATVLTAYRDVTHVAVSSRILWLGAHDSVYVIPRASFENYDAPEILANALLVKIRQQPDGAAQMARIEQVERISKDPPAPVVTRAFIGICVAVFVLQQMLGIRIDLAGELIPELVRDGDLWRIITANLLHAPGGLGFIHIGINMLAMLPLGTMVERPLGPARTICLIVFTGLGSMIAASWFGSGPVVGASGIVFGMAGAVLWLDYKRSDQLPAWWRFPRRNLLGLILINGVLGAIVPIVAFAAHAGGLAFGAIGAAVLTDRVSSPAPLRTKIVSAFALGISFVAVATAGMELAKPGDPAAHYAVRISGIPDISPNVLNDTAWIIATSTNPEPTESVLLAALALADRAVTETERSEPTILDTLAEVLFQLGNTDAAIATIDEAIALDPDSSYFQEQRRRFSGERERDDRPNYIPPQLRPSREKEKADPEPPSEAERELTV